MTETLEEAVGQSTAAVVVKGSALGVVLTAVICVNVGLILRIKWKAQARGARSPLVSQLVLYMAAMNTAAGAINIGSLMVSTIKGSYVFSSGMCQFIGYLGSVLLTGVTMMTVVAAVERFTKFLMPVDYPSLFTSTNLKIIVGGIMLLTLPIFAGPIYGFGEYSFLRGKIHMHISVMNITNGSVLDIEEMRATALKFYGFLYNEDNNVTGPAASRTKQNIRNFFSISRNVQVRDIILTPTALQLTLRAYSDAALSKLWKEQSHHTLGETLGDIINDDYTLDLLHVQRLHFDTFMSQTEVETYRQGPLVYQENSHCSLDYTNVNNNIKSFIGYNTVVTIVIPYCVIFYCYLRILCRRSEPMQPGSEITEYDSKITRMFATSAVLNFLFQTPHTLSSILFGMGTFIPPVLYFLLSILPYCSLVALGLMYKATLVVDVSRMCTCCCPVENRSTDTASMFEVSQVMLRRNSSSVVTERSSIRVHISETST